MKETIGDTILLPDDLTCNLTLILTLIELSRPITVH